MQVSSVWSQTIEEPPSCVAFCPERRELVVIGTYLLHKTAGVETPTDSSIAQKRTGKLLLYRLDGRSLSRLQCLEIESAVLDAEWSPHGTSILAVATSTGIIQFYELKDGALHLITACSVAEADVIVLDLIWHPKKSNVLAYTLSSGEVQLCEINTNETSPMQITSRQSVTTHDLEPWTLAFDQTGRHIYSGGDDATLQHCSVSDDASVALLWADRKTHGAGVTAILPLQRDLIVTGSYDDHIRLIYAPASGRRHVLAEENLGGGVWRLKLLDKHTDTMTILASCMHAGTRIVRLSKSILEDETSWHFEVLAKFEEHQSMNYGTDVQLDPASIKTIVSTSFYDQRVCLWHIDISPAS